MFGVHGPLVLPETGTSKRLVDALEIDDSHVYHQREQLNTSIRQPFGFVGVSAFDTRNTQSFVCIYIYIHIHIYIYTIYTRIT